VHSGQVLYKRRAITVTEADKRGYVLENMDLLSGVGKGLMLGKEQNAPGIGLKRDQIVS
jgi:hypothetical protein